jgi:hypothetical protein
MTARARQVLVASLVDGAAPRVHSLPADTAVLLERGFSAEIRPDGREPVSYDYDRVSPQSPWKVLLGAYIREWAMCARLVERSDDMFVIAKPGDEVALPFPAQPPAAGLQRTYLLQADGFSKEMDIHSAGPDWVEPLPFHEMSSYPCSVREHYPSSSMYEQYRAEFNTRAVPRN